MHVIAGLLVALAVQSSEGAAPLLVIRELSDARGVQVKRELEPAFTKAGFRVAVLTREITDAADLDAWLDETAKAGAFDRAQTVVVGFSAAGVEAARLALAHPKRFCALLLPAALQPIPDGSDLKSAAPHLPQFLVYGARDDTAPKEVGERAKKQLEDAGTHVEWQLLDKADHFGVLRDGAAAMAAWSSTAAFCVSRIRAADEAGAAGKKADARKLLDAIVTKHPKSRFAAEAKKRAAALK